MSIRWTNLCPFLVGFFFLYGAAFARADALDDCAPMLEYTGAPVSDNADEIATDLCRKGYVLAHNNEHRVPDWVLEVLEPYRFEGTAKRKGIKFKPDKDLKPDHRAELEHYKSSGYDRGHMAPAADFKWDQTAMEESFYLSNMAPQVGPGFNRGIWRLLETYTRDLVVGRDTLVVITGPIYEGPSKKSKKNSPVSVPSHFFKIVYDPSRKRAVSFILPNKKVNNRKRVPQLLMPYLASIREIENRSGLDFLAKLSTRQQRRIETVKPLMWRVYEGS